MFKIYPHPVDQHRYPKTHRFIADWEMSNIHSILSSDSVSQHLEIYLGL